MLDLSRVGLINGIEDSTIAEIAMTISTPANPEKPFQPIIEDICQTMTISQSDKAEYFEVEETEEYVYQLTADGILTEKEKTVALLQEPTFIDLASDVRVVSKRELDSCREGGESFYTKHIDAMDRGLNFKETAIVLDLVHAGAVARGNVFDLTDGEVAEGGTSPLTTIDITHIATMIESIEEYADNFIMYCGATVYKQLRNMAWKHNKNSGAYTNIWEFLKGNFNIDKVVPIKLKNGTKQFTFKNMNASGATEEVVSVIPANRALLVGYNTTVGKPIGFLRKSQTLFSGFGGFDENKMVVSGNETVYSDRPMLLIPPPMYNGDVLAYALKRGMVKYETIAVFAKNTYAFAEINV